MNRKKCENCKTEYQDYEAKRFGHCPNCDSKIFTLVVQPEVPAGPPKSEYEIEQEKRLKLDESIEPAVLIKFKRRMELELAEIAYLEWRALQPQWKFQVNKAATDPKSQAITGGFVGPRAVTTAAGVIIGAAVISTEPDERNFGEGGEGGEGGDSSGDEEGGILGLLGDLFS
jgi:DNA-directed RNA polymerase subunit RPC12/RpoP